MSLRPIAVSLALLLFAAAVPGLAAEQEPLFDQKINTVVPPIASDGGVRYDYDIVYVRAHRAGDKVHKRFFTDFSSPVTIEPGADLMLLHPDGSEERLVEGGQGSVTDPVISFDGQWCYYVLLHNMEKANQWTPPAEGSDIYKIHLKTRKIVQLTNQRFSPNTGAAPKWTADYRHAKDDNQANHYATGVYNMGPYPLPGGRIVFTSSRDGFRPAKGYPAMTLQLFVMDDRDENLADDADPRNLEKIGHLNISGALHPVVLRDGRIMFSTLESQGVRGDILWGIWTINPDGTKWNPLVSAFDPGGAPNGFHFQSQLGDGTIVFEEYYNQNNSGFGTLMKMPPSSGEYAGFGPGYMNDARNKGWRFGRHDNGKARWYKMPFMPTGSTVLTPFAFGHEGPADRAVLGDKSSPAVGKFTHPSGAPDNHLLVCYSPGPANHQYPYPPEIDGGIYLLKGGEIVEEPAQLRLIKNDPNYNECWPRAVVPYKRVFGVAEPDRLTPIANDGKASPHLPAGTPYGLVGSSSLYKRESYPNGVVPEGKVTSTFAGGNDPWKGLDSFTSHGNGMSLNWHNQGADAGLYENREIHALRILAMEPTTDRQRGAKSGRQFVSHAKERLRILGEVPVRKFGPDGKETLDPDGNPDTSFLVKLPADTVFTFQTIDKDGLLLNMAQTWHQLRAGEVRTDCGGCHAHSQRPTLFANTLAGKPDFKPVDLTAVTPLVTDIAKDESKRQWDAEKKSGLKTVKQPSVDVEYLRDIRPILQRSCVACHSEQEGPAPAGNLDLDADRTMVNVENVGQLPGTYVRLAADERAKFGTKPVGWDSWGNPQASRYVRKFQARRSMLVWKILGRRTDGFSNDDHPSESEPGKGDLQMAGKQVEVAKFKSRQDVDFLGSQMPPPEAVAGTFKWNGKAIKVEPLSDEDKRTILRWIDLGCPIDQDADAIGSRETYAGYGWKLDDQRPTLAVTGIVPGANAKVEEILIGMADYGTGLDVGSLTVTSTLELEGTAPGTNLAAKFKDRGDGVWVLKLSRPLPKVADATLDVSVKDKQGNLTRIRRSFSVK